MAVEVEPRTTFAIEDILQGKHRELAPEQWERRRRVLAEVDRLTAGVRLPAGYVESLIRTGREAPDYDNASRPGEVT
jgi:hypothetical protein